MSKNKSSKNAYKASIDALRRILNTADPEDLQPGHKDGSPVDEYDAEVAKIYSFIEHKLEDIKVNKQLLVNEINKIWVEHFGNACKDVNNIVNKVCRELF